MARNGASDSMFFLYWQSLGQSAHAFLNSWQGRLNGPGSEGISPKTPVKLQHSTGAAYIIFGQGEVKKLRNNQLFLWFLFEICAHFFSVVFVQYFPFDWNKIFYENVWFFHDVAALKKQVQFLSRESSLIRVCVTRRESRRESIPWFASKVRPCIPGTFLADFIPVSTICIPGS